MSNPNIEKIMSVGEGSLFNLLMVDDWLVCLFPTNNHLWSYLGYLGQQLMAGEPVPEKVYLFTIAAARASVGYEAPSVLEAGKVVKTKLTTVDDDGNQIERFIYTAIHDDHELREVKELVDRHFPQIIEVLYPKE
jgi:hypothetical protein